jgi:hypothetical protein
LLIGRQLSGFSTEKVIQKLQTHLQQNVIYDLLNTAQAPEIKQTNLPIAHQKTPHDLIILAALINIYIEINEQEKAMVIADKLTNIAEEQRNWPQLGNALLMQSKVLTRKELYELSAHKLTKAMGYFEQIGDLKRQAYAWFAQEWLDHQEDELTYLSILAHKHYEEVDQYLYLQQAENKMKSYQLPSYHFAKVPFHYAFLPRRQLIKNLIGNKY